MRSLQATRVAVLSFLSLGRLIATLLLALACATSPFILPALRRMVRTSIRKHSCAPTLICRGFVSNARFICGSIVLPPISASITFASGPLEAAN